jgi:Ca2+-binding EF-hand superfamily protein
MQRSGKRALQKLFAKYDLNRSGTLNAREVAALLRDDLGVEATEQQAQALIEMLSGRVGADLSLADLLSLLQRLRC